jgi:extradiol dioxygenase family protein
MKVQEIAYSAYPVTDMKCTRGFYRGILGLTATIDHEMEGGHWFEYVN